MPAPAAQFSPALPWAPGTRGTILLQEPVSKDDLINGALTFIKDSGQLYQPEGNDGYVDYLDENDSAEISIAIDDEGTTSVLRVSVSVDANVKRVVVGPAVGSVEGLTVEGEGGQPPAVGQQYFVLAILSKDGQTQNALITQDGKTAVTAYIEQDAELNRMPRVFNSSTPVISTLQMKLTSATPTGEFAELPMLRAELASNGGDLAIAVIHAPSDFAADEGIVTNLVKDGGNQAFVGDEVTKLYLKYS